MAFTYTEVDGQRVEVNVASAFRRMGADFKRDTGCSLHVRSGTRTRQEQINIFLSRYVTAANINGRKVYDTRVWNGVRYYRVSAAGTVAVPGTSNHEEDGPNGPRSIDIYDSGSDAGVTRFGTARDRWMQRNAGNYGFENEGNNFNELWHKTYRGSIGGSAGGGGTVGWTETKKQQFLVSLGLDTGGVGNGWGPKSEAATKTFQDWVGLNADGVFGPDTTKVAEVILAGGNYTRRAVSEIQKRLTDLGFPVGAIDNEWGNKTSLGTYRFQRSVGLTADAQWGANTDAKAFPPAPTPEPAPGRNATSRPLKEVQARLGIAQTGVWDQATSDAVLAFQAAQGIEQDRVWGNTSDGLAFPPAGSIHGVDYSFARPAPGMLASRGVKLAGRYLWKTLYDDGVRTNKGISREELAGLTAAGVEVFFIYEEDGKELLGGFDAGVRVAKAAEGYRLALGVGPVPIYFNVDYDATAEQMVPTLAALDGIASVIGLERTGLYGGLRPIKAAFDAGKIAWGFQTYAWSGGVWDSRAQLQQWSNGQWGGTVDFTRAMVPEFGQTPVGDEPDPETVLVDRVELQALLDLSGSVLSSLSEEQGRIAQRIADATALRDQVAGWLGEQS